MNQPKQDRHDCTDRELTVLLTLKDRSAFTMRWMEYANSRLFPFKVLIADGGLSDEALILLADKARFPNVDYEYVRYRPDNTYADYYAKMADALDRVGTAYVVMADNDDFFVVERLREAIRFLAANPDYVHCGGQGAVFWMGASSRSRSESPPQAGKPEWKCSRELRSIDGPTAWERLRIVSVRKADPSYYDVRRSEVARKQMAVVRDLNLKDLFLVEHLIWFLSTIAGKTRRLERLYVARQQDSPDSTGGVHEILFGDWFGRMLVPSWSEDFAKFIDTVSAELAQADGISREEATRCVIAAYRASVAPALLSDLMDEPTVTVSMTTVVGAVRRLVGLPERSVLRRLARTLYRRLNWVSLEIVYGTEFVTVSVPGAARDFKPILEFLGRAK